jgi:plasmid stabilization system protein ParE
MRHYEIIILPSAERNIGEACEWIAEHDEEAAVRWYNGLMELILSLETFPERAPLAPESKHLQREIREVFHGRRRHKYRILFTVTESEVYVLHVRHGARASLGGPETVGD